ncbi:MAG: prepilin peptidase [Verrucomicrobiales bacterium]|nr:prepilin peptidase [Verrucomicrobiales bacterium]
MPPEVASNILIPAAVFLLGGWVGSIINGIVHSPNPGSIRRGLVLRCPNCTTPVRQALSPPFVSSILHRGKCKTCRHQLPRQYLIVELLTATVFVVIWLLFSQSPGLWAAYSLWLLCSLMIAAAYVDYDQLVIPDKITLRGIGAGFIASAIAPGLHGEFTWYNGMFSSAVGIVTGFVVLWAILIAGKILFGRINHKFSESVDFSIDQPGGEDDPILISLGPNHKYLWHEVFYRRWDKMRIAVTGLHVNGQSVAVQKEFVTVRDGFLIDGEKIELHTVSDISGKCTGALVPREALGFGNVKFVSMIGAFIGWQAVLIAILTAFGIVLPLRRFVRRKKISFSPFLAFGAFVFILFKFL